MTETNHTKLVSIRIDLDVLRKLDDYVSNRRYLSRSSLINRILHRTIGHMADDEFFELITH